MGQLGGKWVQISQIMCRYKWKVVQILQFLVSHHLRSYSGAFIFCWSSHTCLTGTQVMGQIGETGLKYPKSHAGRYEKQSKVFSSFYNIRWDLTLVSRPSLSWVVPASQVLGYWGNLEKLGPKIPNHAQGHTKSNLKTSVPHLISNDILLTCEGHLRVQLQMSDRCLSIMAIWENKAEIPPNHMRWHMKSNPKSSAPHFTSN